MHESYVVLVLLDNVKSKLVVWKYDPIDADEVAGNASNGKAPGVSQIDLAGEFIAIIQTAFGLQRRDTRSRRLIARDARDSSTMKEMSTLKSLPKKCMTRPMLSQTKVCYEPTTERRFPRLSAPKHVGTSSHDPIRVRGFEITSPASAILCHKGRWLARKGICVGYRQH